MSDEVLRELYVLDTSSLLWIRYTSNISRDHWKGILSELEDLVEDGTLVFPREVLMELRRFHVDLFRGQAVGLVHQVGELPLDALGLGELLDRRLDLFGVEKS